MAISEVVASQAAVLLAAYLCLKKSGVAPLWVRFPVLQAVVTSGLVSLLSLPSFNHPGLLGKTRDGGFPVWSTVIFGPFHVFVRLYVYLKRWKRRGRKEPAYDEVAPGLFLGGWPDSHKRMPPGKPAVVDCTCELPRRSFVFAKDQPYLCIPSWDTRAPLPAEMDAAVRWACERRAEKRPVLVHCAFGHGRSASVICAVLIGLGLTEDWKTAEKMVKEKRPHSRMNAFQRGHLEEWYKSRVIGRN